MAINIQHTYTTQVEVVLDGVFRYSAIGNLDEIAEGACEHLIKHNFTIADVISTETGEVLMVIKRT